VGPKFCFFQVNYRKLLEMDPFFLSHINLGVGKLQDIGNKICQTVGDALRHDFFGLDMS
jgi:hypothetical protein